MPVDDSGQDVGEIGERIDVVELASLDQGRDDRVISLARSAAESAGACCVCLVSAQLI